MIYLDNAATAFPKAPGVAEAVAASLRDLPGSVGRSTHGPALEAARRLYAVRRRLAAFLGVDDPRNLVFTKNATEALNLAILGVLGDAESAGRPRLRVLASSYEHNAVMRPLAHLSARGRIELSRLDLDPSGLPFGPGLDLLEAGRLDLLVVTGASNVTGVLPPVAALAARARARGGLVLVDGSQLAGHGACRLGTLGADLLALPGHKGLLGPAGTGVLALAPGLGLEPLLRGGTGSASESLEGPFFLPDRLEAGTGNLAALEGLGAAVAWLEAEGVDAVAARVGALLARLRRGLEALGVEVLGPEAGTPVSPILSCRFPGRALDEVALALEEEGVASRMGLHCAPEAHRSLGTLAEGGSLRLSPGAFTTPVEVEETLDAMKEILR